jgi:hypothetical protein
MSDPRDSDLVVFNNDSKFDFQLNRSKLDELDHAHRLLDGKFEHKCERYQPWDTGNICIENARRGRPSGIAVTEANLWAHELKYHEVTIATLHFPVPILRKLVFYFANDPARDNRFFGGGDDGLSDGVLIPIGPLRHWGRIILP